MDKYCIDCEKLLTFNSSTGRCKSCQAKYRWAQPGFKERVGVSVSAGQKKFHAEHPEAGEVHSAKLKKRYEDPENREILAAAARERWKDPDNRKEQSERIKRYYDEHPEAVEAYAVRMQNYFDSNPGARELCNKVLIDYYGANPEARSEIMKKYYAEHPEAIELQSAHLARMREEFWADPENRVKASEFWAAYSNDPVNKAHNSETSKALWQDPEYREKGMQHIYEVFLPAAFEWQSLPENKQLMAERAAAQLARGFYGRQSSLELMVQDFLDANGIKYIPQYKPDNYNRVYDFLLPDAMPPILIEVDGYYWHASPDAISWGQAETDAEKDTWALDNGFTMLRLPEESLRSTGARELIFGVI